MKKARIYAEIFKDGVKPEKKSKVKVNSYRSVEHFYNMRKKHG